MFQILCNQFIGDVAAAPCAVANRPEVLAPISPSQLPELLLQASRCPPFEPLDDFAHRLRGRVLNQHMDVIFTDHPLENPDVFRIANLHDQVVAALLDLSLQDWVAVLRHPDQVDSQACNRVAVEAVLRHATVLPQSRHLRKMCSN